MPQKNVKFHAGAVWYFVSGNFMPPLPKFSLVAQCQKGSTADWPESFPWRGSANIFHAILTCMVPLGSAVEFRCSGSLTEAHSLHFRSFMEWGRSRERTVMG